MCACRSVVYINAAQQFKLRICRVQVSDDSSGSDRSDRYCYHRSTGLVHRHRFVLFNRDVEFWRPDWSRDRHFGLGLDWMGLRLTSYRADVT